MLQQNFRNLGLFQYNSSICVHKSLLTGFLRD